MSNSREFIDLLPMPAAARIRGLHDHLETSVVFDEVQIERLMPYDLVIDPADKGGDQTVTMEIGRMDGVIIHENSIGKVTVKAFGSGKGVRGKR